MRPHELWGPKPTALLGALLHLGNSHTDSLADTIDRIGDNKNDWSTLNKAYALKVELTLGSAPGSRMVQRIGQTMSLSDGARTTLGIVDLIDFAHLLRSISQANEAVLVSEFHRRWIQNNEDDLQRWKRSQLGRFSLREQLFEKYKPVLRKLCATRATRPESPLIGLLVDIFDLDFLSSRIGIQISNPTWIYTTSELDVFPIDTTSESQSEEFRQILTRILPTGFRPNDDMRRILTDLRAFQIDSPAALEGLLRKHFTQILAADRAKAQEMSDGFAQLSSTALRMLPPESVQNAAAGNYFPHSDLVRIALSLEFAEEWPKYLKKAFSS